MKGPPSISALRERSSVINQTADLTKLDGMRNAILGLPQLQRTSVLRWRGMSGTCGAAGAHRAVGINEMVELIEVDAIVLVIAVNDGGHYL